MNTEKQIVEILYRKIGGLSFAGGIFNNETGKVLPNRANKGDIERFVRNGGLPAILESLCPDPSRLDGYGTRKIQKRMDILARSTQESGQSLSEAISEILRTKGKMPNKAPEPTPGPVTSRAVWISEMVSSRKARLAPGPVVAHL